MGYACIIMGIRMKEEDIHDESLAPSGTQGFADGSGGSDLFAIDSNDGNGIWQA
jgi:hypothetical protein